MDALFLFQPLRAIENKRDRLEKGRVASPAMPSAAIARTL
jgi:hypothetical protein